MAEPVYLFIRPAVLALLLMVLGGVGVAVPAQAQGSAPGASAIGDDDVLFNADRLSYDQELGIVSAEGNVEISSGARILRANSVSFNERTDTVSASGDVSILEPTGEVLFAEYAELTDRLRSGAIKSIRILMTDRSRFAAADAVRENGNVTTMSHAVYSACQLCPDHPNRPPLWQIKAVEVIHNQKLQRVDYKDAFLEVYGVPIAYTPYFSHPDPTVKAKTGLLPPSYGSSSELGYRITTPYYIRLSPSRDMTLAPTFTSKEGIVLGGEYRERTAGGRYLVDASLTRVDERDDNNAKTGSKDIRGHIFADGNFTLNPTWRWGFKGRRTTDDTYLRRYDISSEDTLTSKLFVEGFRGRQYFALNSYAFQGLREDDDPGTTPLVMPQLEYAYVGKPGRRGQSWRVDASALSLYRADGQDTQRLSIGSTWRLPHTTKGGSVYALTARMRGDGYHVTSMPNASNAALSDSGFRGRLLPLMALDWRLPMVRSVGTVRQVIEPVVSAVAAPYGGNPDSIPNEDSLSFEFDDTNVFSVNRFPGLDRWEGGPRVNYGLKVAAYGQSGGYSTAMIGQSYRLKADSTFADRTGLENKRSDYVGRLTISPSEFLDYVQRIRIDRDTLTIRRNEFDLAVGPERLRLDLGYLSLSKELTANDFASREELRMSAKARLTNTWSADAHSRRDLTQEGGSIAHGLGLVYEDECVVFTTRFDRTFTQDRDVQPSSSITFRVRLKGLG